MMTDWTANVWWQERAAGAMHDTTSVDWLATVTIDYQGGCRGVWIKQAMFLLKEKVVQGILSNAVFIQKYYFLTIVFFKIINVEHLFSKMQVSTS